MNDFMTMKKLVLILFIHNLSLLISVIIITIAQPLHKNSQSSPTWKFESEEKEKSLAIDDFLEQQDSDETADTPSGRIKRSIVNKI